MNTITVTTGFWFDEPAGIEGFNCDGWVGETPEEAVALHYIDALGVDCDEAASLVTKTTIVINK